MVPSTELLDWRSKTRPLLQRFSSKETAAKVLVFHIEVVGSELPLNDPEAAIDWTVLNDPEAALDWTVVNDPEAANHWTVKKMYHLVVKPMHPEPKRNPATVLEAFRDLVPTEACEACETTGVSQSKILSGTCATTAVIARSQTLSRGMLFCKFTTFITTTKLVEE
jgi:hypothetical protein